MSDKQVAVRDPQQQALEKLKKYEGSNALVFVRQEDVRAGALTVPEVVAVPATLEDFHNISGNLMPKSHQTNAIAEAAGIVFTENCGTRKEGPDTWVGWAQGRRRMPDGTMRTSPVLEYEFDVQVRSEEDFQNDAKKSPSDRKYGNEVAKQRHVVELRKFARSRASTGAYLRVIRQLANMPTAFSRAQIQQGKAFVFVRYALNTDKMLESPEMRRDALAIATGAVSSVYGPRNVTPETEAPRQIEASEPTNAPDDDEPFSLESDPPTDPPKNDRRTELAQELEEFALAYENNDMPKRAQSIRDTVGEKKPDSDEYALDADGLVPFLSTVKADAKKRGWS